MNLLMISIDDLRPLLGCYGQPRMHTPNLDRLAGEGVRFSRAFCQVPVCGASRASVLTGLRPTTDRFIDYHARADEDAPRTPTLLHHLKDHGYTLVGNPKILHHRQDHHDVWDRYHQAELPGFPGPYHSERAKGIAAEREAIRKSDQASRLKAGPSWETADVADEAYHDGDAARFAIGQLAELANQDQPWMLGYGSIDVHLPFKAPQRYWDLYDPATIELPPDFDRMPTDVPPASLHNWGELRNYAGIPPEGPLDEAAARRLIHGYMAGVSYFDAQIGKVLDALDANGLRDSTAVVLWVDHGFNLGEHGLWCKHCLYETSLHVPLIMRPPASTGIEPGTVVRRVVENLDIFPTVCDLLDLPTPEHVQGRSLLPLMHDPQATWADAAVSRYHGGESIRTDRYRYSEWRDDAGELIGRALFDHHDDPGERTNLAEAAGHQQTCNDLSAQLAATRAEAESVNA